MAMMQIVLALTDTDVVPTDKWTTSRGDGINAAKVLATVKTAKACMWKRRGNAADLYKATEYALKNGFELFTFPMTEKDPLGAAKRLVLAR